MNCSVFPSNPVYSGKLYHSYFSLASKRRLSYKENDSTLSLTLLWGASETC
jgi:hypothetical protein